MDTESPIKPVSSGFEALAKAGRIDARMRTDGKPYTDDERVALLQELADFRNSRQTSNGKAIAWKTIAEECGIEPSVLSEVNTNKYRGDVQKVLRMIDQYLADARLRAGRFDDRAFASIGLVKTIYGVIMTAIKHCSMALVCADPGDGKSTIASAFVASREGAVLVRIDESSGDQRGVSALLYQALRLVGTKSHRERMSAIMSYLRKAKSVVILVDECQKLKADGLEALRDIHDGSDLDRCRNTPIILFGDHNFYRLLVRSRNGETSPIRPQLSRRLYPVLNVEGEISRGGGDKFSIDDIVRIFRNDRLRVLSDQAVKWLCSLANVRGFGSLGFAMAVARMAFDIAKSTPIGVDDLRAALSMAIGPRAVNEIDGQAGGQLLQKVG